MKKKVAIVKWLTGDDYMPSGDKEVRTFKWELPGWCVEEPEEWQKKSAWFELAKLAYAIGIIRVKEVSVEIIEEEATNGH